MFDALFAVGLVQRFCAAITGDDVLLQLNVLQFVPRAAASHTCAAHMLDTGTRHSPH